MNPIYRYESDCPHCGNAHSLDRSDQAVRAARELHQKVAHDPRFSDEGKMLGALVGTTEDGETIELHAFSGMLGGSPFSDGFVGPTRSGSLTADDEERTLEELAELSARIAGIDPSSLRSDLADLDAAFEQRIAEASDARRLARAKRRRRRESLAGRSDDQAAAERQTLALQSSAERGALRELRIDRDAACAPLRTRIAALEEERRELRRERRRRSQALQAAMHAAHGLVNFAGRYALLRELFGNDSIPSGAAECCAPKLLHEAALRGIRPTGLAEIWCGPTPADASKHDGQLYGACREKCVPILGHLLCGADRPQSGVRIAYEDEAMIVVDKPVGLCSVAGRGSRLADSVESRLQLLRPEESFLRAVHRLDQGTSGLLVIARSAETHRELSKAFAARQVDKCYRAIVAGCVASDQGEVSLPLSPSYNGPHQSVDREAGKPALTRYRVVRRSADTTELALFPVTGRTHQLRIHCARGLGSPILGDPLYGEAKGAIRLMLHAQRLELPHPTHAGRIVVESNQDWASD